ncbi:DUF3987 domain-containing protein [Hymenobacter sp. ISL-91]|uniref:DUF3987 domain-containing protein n=1 Tax=Hymenobacter sp. ISL-91 TaxID=2819151 RepID=UPI001BECAFF9|nr:DUF3987 domain-containing protein [Hymenobacter sp. ISL-91]
MRAALGTQEEYQPQDTTPEGFPAEVYEALPRLLQECCQPFTAGHERDILLLGVLGVLSGCFLNVTGTYDGQTVWPMLYTFVIAPAANGKGGLSMARRLAYPIHAGRVQESREAQGEYEAAVEQHAQHMKTQRGRAEKLLGHAQEPPAMPPFRQLFIPGNSSAASILTVLDANQGQGIIFESEGDTIAGALKQEWGSYSDLLRKGFHHEAATSQRKTGREFLEVDSPKLAVVITSTKGQVPGIIPNAENGLFSRFLFYYCNPPQLWRNVGPDNGRGNLTQHFDQLAERVGRLVWDVCEPVTVELSAEQWQALNEQGAAALAKAVHLHGDEAGSIIKRLGLILFRLCMLLTVLRAHEEGTALRGTLTCNDLDFNTASVLLQVCRRHALALFEQMPREQQPQASGRRYAARQTKTEQAIALHQQGVSQREIARTLEIPEATLRGWLKAAA